MTTDTPPPRRKWHLQRWLLLLAAGFLAYGGWTQYAFRAALKEARALGWDVNYTSPARAIRANWKAAFKKETWLDGVIAVRVPTSREFKLHLAIIHRLDPESVQIINADTLGDLSALKPLTRLKRVVLSRCTRLTNVDALKSLPALQWVWLEGCTGLSEESVASLKAALPNTEIFDP